MPRGPTFQPRAHRRLWWGALVTALVLSLLPTRWLVGWTSEVSGLVRFPLRPFEHVASSVREWLRPASSPYAGKPEELANLEREREVERTLRKKVELERDELLRRIAHLERTKDHVDRWNRGASEHTRFIHARIVSTQAPTARNVAGSLEANVGERQGVSVGMIAVWEGDIVAGRIDVAPGRFASIVTPVSALSGIEVRFFPPPDRNVDLAPANAPGGVLKEPSDGGWTVDLTQPGEIEKDWIARVADERWPAAYGMRIGIVDRVGTRDDAPLVRRLVVRPLVDPFRIPHVELVDDRADGGGE